MIHYIHWAYQSPGANEKLNPKPTDKATGLKPLCTIKTYHTYGYHGLFKPSIAEVLVTFTIANGADA